MCCRSYDDQKRNCREPRESWWHTHEVALETRSRPIEPRLAVSTRVMELETAKEIMEEVFYARPDEVGRDDKEVAGGERARGAGARGGAVDGDVLLIGATHLLWTNHA